MPPILLYDGVCGLCNRLVQFILRRDRDGRFRFAPLQSALAGRILARHGANQPDLDALCVVLNHDPGREDQAGEFLLARSDAVIFILRQLSRIWRFAAVIAQPVPRPLRDWIYGLIARNRYRAFGRYDTCPVPSEETRSRFLDL